MVLDLLSQEQQASAKIRSSFEGGKLFVFPVAQ